MSDPTPPPIVPDPDLPDPVVPDPDLPAPLVPDPDLPEPAAVRVPAGPGTAVVPAADAVVLDAPDLLPLLAGRRVLAVPPGLAAPLADLLGVELASELADVTVASAGVRREVPHAVRAILPGAPDTWLEHEEVRLAGGHDVDWRVDRGEVHAATLDGLARGLAWAAGRWSARGDVAALLAEPGRAEELALEADLDDQ